MNAKAIKILIDIPAISGYADGDTAGLVCYLQINDDTSASYSVETSINSTAWMISSLRSLRTSITTTIDINSTHAHCLSQSLRCDNVSSQAGQILRGYKASVSAITSLKIFTSNATYPFPVGATISVIETEIL